VTALVLKILGALITQTLDNIVSTMALDTNVAQKMYWDGAGTQDYLLIVNTDLG
jgi:hypothetical protein